MIRGVVQSVSDGAVRLLEATGRIGETFKRVSFMQHYGFASRPLPGAEVLIDAKGNVTICIASDDRRYRIALENGEAALYTDEGDKVHLKRGRQIEIVGGEKVMVTTKIAEISAETSATVTSPQVTIVASSKVTMTTPLVEVSGDITCTNLTASATVTGATVADAGGAKTMAGMREVFGTHNHQENGTGGGTTGGPNQGM